MRMDDIAMLTPLLVAIGGAIAWWVRRSERREAMMIDLYKQRALDAEERFDDEQAARELWERRATRWHQQIVDAGLKPDPRWGDPV